MSCPSTEATASSIAYENGTAKWYGTLDRAAAVWTITALGLYDNPTGPGTAQVRRKLTAKVPISPTLTQPLNNPAWDYMYSTGTGNTCDQTMNNNVVGNARMYVAGNLCIGNNAGTALSALIVKGDLDLSNNTNVGASTSMATRVETYVGGNCRYGGGTWAACSGNQDARHIYSKLSNGTTIGVTHTTPVIAAPTADFASWYENAIPGPAQPCTTTTGTPPSFDGNYPARDNSVGVVDLTPTSSYVCRVGPGASTTLPSAINASQTSITVASASGFPASGFRIRIDDELMNVTGGFGTTTWTVTRGVNSSAAAAHVVSQTLIWDDSDASGELSWNVTTKTLTAKGTIYIDGSAKVANGAVNTYNGQAAIYLSGTFLLDGKLCGAVSGSKLRLRRLEPEHRDADDRGERHRRPGSACGQHPACQQQPVRGRIVRDGEGRIRQQRIHGRAGHGERDHPLEQRDGERIPDDHDCAGRHAFQPGGLRPAEPAAPVRRLTPVRRRLRNRSRKGAFDYVQAVTAASKEGRFRPFQGCPCSA